MDSVFRGDLATPAGRLRAWIDSLFVDHALLRLGWSNFGVVLPGRMYRCNHPTPGRLARLARRLGLRTLINLRGATGNGSDALSREAARRLGLDFVDIAMRSGAAPSRARLLDLIGVLEAARLPALLHCKSGADRAGFAAGVFLLLRGGTATAALAQLSLRHGHLRSGRAGVLDGVFLAYAQSAATQTSFAAWVREAYDPDAVARQFAPRALASAAEQVLARE